MNKVGLGFLVVMAASLAVSFFYPSINGSSIMVFIFASFVAVTLFTISTSEKFKHPITRLWFVKKQ